MGGEQELGDGGGGGGGGDDSAAMMKIRILDFGVLDPPTRGRIPG